MSLLRLLTRTIPVLRTQIPAIVVTSSRAMAETPGNMIINLDDKGVATLQLNRKPVNALSLELINDLHIALDNLESQKTCKGLIITSALDGIFTGGVDFREIYNSEEARLREFHRTLLDFWIKLYGSRLITFSVINGHSPAGGCVIACASDYRIMAEGTFTIGLNETRFGLVASYWFRHILPQIVGHRESELALQLGHLYSPEEAKHAGLVDEIAPMDQVMTRAHAEMEKWIKIPEAARVLSKKMMRQSTIDILRSRLEDYTDEFVNLCRQDSVQKTLHNYIKSVKNKWQSKL